MTTTTGKDKNMEDLKNNQNDLQKKLSLISRINWDYNFTEDQVLKIIEDKNNDSVERINFYVKSLETFTWQDLVFLWGLDEVDRLYTDKTRRMIFSKFLREEYDGVFELLRNKTLSYTERSPEELEEFKSALLFNRRNRCKQRVFSSPLLRRP